MNKNKVITGFEAFIPETHEDQGFAPHCTNLASFGRFIIGGACSLTHLGLIMGVEASEHELDSLLRDFDVPIAPLDAVLIASFLAEIATAGDRIEEDIVFQSWVQSDIQKRIKAGAEHIIEKLGDDNAPDGVYALWETCETAESVRFWARLYLSDRRNGGAPIRFIAADMKGGAK